MKKPYQKPLLLAESFALAEHIAECSGQDNTHGNQTDAIVCSYTVGSEILFYNTGTGCVSLVPGMEGDLDGELVLQCYNGPFVGDLSVTAFGS